MSSPVSTRPPFPAPRRVATAPLPTTSSTSSGSPPSDGIVETLYNHPSAKIISFTASGRALAQSPGNSPGTCVDTQAGTLSWSSQLERTIAVGPFRIYRAPGSVAFLNCGSALQPILPKSQCWCIDENNSKFVLQIRRPTYWRIELPTSDPEDQHRAEDLRAVLDNILQFEKTECPFQRTFTVQLPELTPVKKKPWTPVGKSLITNQINFETSPISPTPTVRHPPRSRASTRGPARSVSPAEPVQPTLTRSKTWSTLVSKDASDDEDREGGVPLASGLLASSSADQTTVASRIDALEVGASLTELEVDKCASGPQQAPIFLPTLAPSGMASGLRRASLPVFDGGPNRFNLEETGDIQTIDEQPVLSRRSSDLQILPQEDPVVYELHEGTGSQRNKKSVRLRRTAGFATGRPIIPLPSPQSPTEAQLPRTIGDLNHDQQNDVDTEAEKQPVRQPPSPRRDCDDSFHSVKSWHSDGVPLPPSPPTSDLVQQAASVCDDNDLPSDDGNDEASTGESDDHEDQVSDSVTKASEIKNLPRRASATDLGTSTGVVARDGAASATANLNRRRRSATTCHRATTGSISVRRRALSPLPPAANLLHPPSTANGLASQGRLSIIKNLPLTIIAKTYEMILGPPSYLVALMLKVAAKIVAGQWRGFVYGYGDSGETIPVQWDYSEDHFSDWSDDEPYMGVEHKAKASRSAGPGEYPASETSDDRSSWGVD